MCYVSPKFHFRIVSTRKILILVSLGEFGSGSSPGSGQVFGLIERLQKYLQITHQYRLHIAGIRTRDLSQPRTQSLQTQPTGRGLIVSYLTLVPATYLISLSLSLSLSLFGL
ncbi:hypothetical protein RIF29_23172 [Crotalaria pallida]|uniref:Uncharacterized protein n=1 Tax=Crotalaria pallida TaxID=3830 RepID=A0AAN9F7A3_CROPI